MSRAELQRNQTGRFYCSKRCRRNPAREKERARLAAWAAVQNGRLKKPTSCALCKRRARLYAHHEDYTKPLEVHWLCRTCHDIVHYLGRVDWVESRRKYTAANPCACGAQAVARGMCKRCYAHEYQKTRAR